MNVYRRAREYRRSRLGAGDVIEVCYPIFKHYAIVSDRIIGDRPALISLSRRTGCVTEEPWRHAVGDRRFDVSFIHGGLPGELVVARARWCMLTGIVKYNLLTFNCEHFVRFVHGLPRESAQVRSAVKGACIGVASALLLPQFSVSRALLLTGAGALTTLRRHARKRQPMI